MSKADTVAFEYAKEKGTLGLDYNQIYDAVKHGYHQAEKYNELTWKDIEAIDQISTDVFKDVFDVGTKEFYQEVLKRFKDLKK